MNPRPLYERPTNLWCQIDPDRDHDHDPDHDPDRDPDR
jgi:hypothetical protein